MQQLPAQENDGTSDTQNGEIEMKTTVPAAQNTQSPNPAYDPSPQANYGQAGSSASLPMQPEMQPGAPPGQYAQPYGVGYAQPQQPYYGQATSGWSSPPVGQHMIQPTVPYAQYTQQQAGVSHVYVQQPSYGSPVAPVQQLQPQPQQAIMVRPEVMPGCPPGLESLTTIEELAIRQPVNVMEGWQKERLHYFGTQHLVKRAKSFPKKRKLLMVYYGGVLADIRVEKKYRILNPNGQQILFASEAPRPLTYHNHLPSPSMGFNIYVTDNIGQEVIRVTKATSGGVPWFSVGNASEALVEAPPGLPVGYVLQEQSFCQPRFQILDANRAIVLLIRGPEWICHGDCCTDDVNYEVLNDSEVHLGRISKQWTGHQQETYTTANNYGISFRLDLNVKHKVLIIGAMFLIDFTYFNYRASAERHTH